MAPTPTCRRHETWEHDEPCRACGADRVAYDAWREAIDAEWEDAMTDSRTATPTPPRLAALKADECPEHPGYPIIRGRCDRCESNRHEHKGAA